MLELKLEHIPLYIIVQWFCSQDEGQNPIIACGPPMSTVSNTYRVLTMEKLEMYLWLQQENEESHICCSLPCSIICYFPQVNGKWLLT